MRVANQLVREIENGLADEIGGGMKMKTTKLIVIGLVILFLISLPVAANAHGVGGGMILGFGAGLVTGYLFAPRPLYIAPPAYAAPPPVIEYRYPDAAAANPGPNVQSICREWRIINRQWENRWNPYQGRWRTVLVEKWGWVQAPCGH